MLWVAGLSFTLSARRPDGHARGFPPAALIGLGLLPTAWGALQWGRAVIHTFATLGEASGDERSLIIAGTLATARAELVRTASLSTARMPILAAIACALIALRGRERDPAAPPARAPSARLLLAATAIALVAAVFLAVEARSMARENDVPWPPPSVGERFPSPDPPHPGSARARRAGAGARWFEIFGNRLGLDGSEGETVASLEEKLVTLRSFHRQLHPDSFFDGAAVVLANPDDAESRLLAVLDGVARRRIVKPVFGFTRAEVVVRPVLGRLQRVYGSGASIRLAYVDGKDEDEYEDDDDAAAWKDAVPLRPRDFPVTTRSRAASSSSGAMARPSSSGSIARPVDGAPARHGVMRARPTHARRRRTRAS